MKVPTPPETRPVRICCRVTSEPKIGLMLTSLFVLCAAVKSAVQVRSRVAPRSTPALTLNSSPSFFMLPMFVVRKFDRFVPAATGTVKIRSLVFLL